MTAGRPAVAVKRVGWRARSTRVYKCSWRMMHRVSAFCISCSYVAFAVLTTTRWKEVIEDRMSKLEESVKQYTAQSSTTTPTNDVAFQPLSTSIPRPALPNTSFTSQTPGAVTLNLSCSLGAFPASSMKLTLGDSGANAGRTLDPVSCGIISLATAEAHFAFYKDNLDPSIHHALNDNDTFSSTRAGSTLLTTAICTVSARCTGSKDYSSLLHTFKAQVSGKVFSSCHTFDDIRALCIGALWLNETSTALNGLGKLCPKPQLDPPF